MSEFGFVCFGVDFHVLLFFGGKRKRSRHCCDCYARIRKKEREALTDEQASKQAVVRNTQSVSVRAGYQYVRCQMSNGIIIKGVGGKGLIGNRK